MSENKKEQATVRSLRITDDVMALFKQIQSETGYTQDGVLKMLINSFQLEKARSILPDREVEISNFQNKLNEILDAYVHSLQLNLDSESRIRAEIELQLKSKEKLIIDLQNTVTEMKGAMEEKDAAVFNAETKMMLAETALEDIKEKTENLQAIVRDKENINTMLTGKLAEAEEKSKAFDNLKKTEEECQKKLQAALQEIKDIKKDAELEKERAIISVQREMDKALLEAEQTKNAEIQKLRDKIDQLKDELIKSKTE